MSSLSVYLLGSLVLPAGLAMAAHLVGLLAAWIDAGGTVRVGLGGTKARRREPSPTDV